MWGRSVANRVQMYCMLFAAKSLSLLGAVGPMKDDHTKDLMFNACFLMSGRRAREAPAAIVSPTTRQKDAK